MAEELRVELSDAEFNALCDLANKNGITPEERAALLIAAYFDTSSRHRKMEASVEFLRENADAVLDTVAQGPVYVRAENARAFVIFLKDTYDRLSDHDCFRLRNVPSDLVREKRRRVSKHIGTIVDNRRILMVRLSKARREARWAQLSQRFPPVRNARVNRLRSMGRTSNTLDHASFGTFGIY